MQFLLGTHEPSWLGRTDVPLFISAVRLRPAARKRRAGLRARGKWCLDSGGFSQLSEHGQWFGTDADYAAEVREWGDSIGGLQWAAIRDHMCEPFILAKTGGTVRDHQMRTIESLVNLRAIAPSIAWTPVLQGWQPDDYEQHAQAYCDAGFDLSREPIVGVGSVCRRQGTKEGAAVFRRVASLGLRVHAFGVKADGLRSYGPILASADSMAWSFVARRRQIKLDGCEHARCNNCFRFAMKWRESIVLGGQPAQTSFGF
jgi:hypothetical protein